MYRLILMLSIVIFCSYCGNENSDTGTTETNTANTTTSTPVKKHYEASHEAPFCKLWVVQGAIGVDDQSNYLGRWFNLKTDGSFESGQWEQTTNSGTWGIEASTNIIKFVFNTPETIPFNWKIQGSGGGGRILFKGNIPGNERGLQVMLEPATEPPTQQ